jgi:adenylate cyclase class 2
MSIEYEATFPDIKKEEVRERLRKAGAVLVRAEFLQRRVPFHLPKEKRAKNKFARVRDEGDKITLSFKSFEGDKIEDQKEICLEVNDFDEAVKFLEEIGCEAKSYQESKREIWGLDGVEITIDEWPFLEPLVEVEGKSEEEVKRVSEKIGFDYDKALFCPTGQIYQAKYNIPEDKINTAPRIVFDMENPFTK